MNLLVNQADLKSQIFIEQFIFQPKLSLFFFTKNKSFRWLQNEHLAYLYKRLGVLFWGITTLLVFFQYPLFSQETEPMPLISCYLDEHDAFSSVLLDFSTSNLRTKTSTFSIEYVDVPEEAKPAIEKAVNIWELILNTNVPINIKFTWQQLSSQTLAQSGASSVHRNFRNALYKDVWYPTPLAEAIAGAELNTAGKTDMVVNLNKMMNWSYTTDGRPYSGKFDLTTVVLHEIAHGLGFNSSFDTSTNTTYNIQEGKWGQSGYAYIFDIFVIDAFNRKLFDTKVYGNPSEKLYKIMTSDEVFFDNQSINPNVIPKIYAPSTFKAGGSISHLDEEKYPIGSENSLMSPTIRSGEVIHKPGIVTLSMLYKIGWSVNANVISEEIVTAIEPEALPEVLVFPNPATDVIQVAVPLASPRSLQLNLLNGNGLLIETISEQAVTNKTYSISCKNLTSGLYFIQITEPDRVTTKKIIVR